MSDPSQVKHRFSAKRVSLVLGLGVVLVVAINWWLSPHEPEYQGRKISVWLQNYPQYKQKDWRETEAAMRAFGTNGIPYIMRQFTNKNSFWKNAHFRLWYHGPLWVKKALGVPDTRRLDARYAPEIFAAIGPSSIPLLIEALKQENRTVQTAAALALGYFGPEAKAALPELRNCWARTQVNGGLREVVSNSIVQIDPNATSRRP